MITTTLPEGDIAMNVIRLKHRNKTPLERLDKQIAKLQARLEKLGAIRAAFADKEIADDLEELFSATRGTQETNLERMQRFFREIENEWATVNEIVEETELGRDSVRQVIYKTNPKEFESRPHPAGGRKREFRLADKKGAQRARKEEKEGAEIGSAKPS